MYDENSNVRHLAQVSPEAVEKQHGKLEDLDRELDRARKKAAIFNSKGWKLVTEDLIRMWQAGDVALRSRKVRDIQDVEFLRGQLAAFETLINLGEEARRRLEVLTAQYESEKNRLEQLQSIL